MLSSAGCAYRAKVPPAQLPALLAAKDAEVRVRDIDGDWVTIDRAAVSEVWVQPHAGYRLMTGGYGERGSGAAVAVPIPESREREAERQGWVPLGELQGESLRLGLRGEMLVVENARIFATVPLRDVAYVDLKEPSYGGTVLIVVASIAGAGLIGYLSLSGCDGCLAGRR